MNYKLVIFDFDGTLADSYSWFLSVYRDFSERFGLPAVDEAEMQRLRTLDVHQIMKQYQISFWKLLRMGRHLTRLMSSQIEQVRLVDGMQPVIDSLAYQGVRMAIITSNAEKNVRRVLGPHNMARIEFLESGVSMFGKKRKIHKILQRSGVAASDVLSIGDEVRDLKSSHEAQVDFGAVAWGTTDLATLQKHSPKQVFQHPVEILQLLTEA
jgi:phosphoglycolate phosphatase